MLKKPKVWDGKYLKGTWDMTIKLDGVRAIIKDGVALSRNGKPLHNLSHIPDGDYEVYLGSWEASVSAVRTHNGGYIDHSACYSLDPLDHRLYIRTIDDPTTEFIREQLKMVCMARYEGLVLRQGDNWIKVKPKENMDIVVTGYNEGKGRNVGRMGSLITERGNVPIRGDNIMQELWSMKDTIIGMTIEVSFWELTKQGKFRFPNYERLRFDKDA